MFDKSGNFGAATPPYRANPTNRTTLGRMPASVFVLASAD